MTESQSTEASPVTSPNDGYNEISKETSNPFLALIISMVIIFCVFGFAFFFKPVASQPMELKLAKFGDTVPKEERYQLMPGGEKAEKFPMEFKKLKELPYAPAYRLCIYLNKSKVIQRDLRKFELDAGGIVGFPLKKMNNSYIAVIEEMHGGDNIKPISNVVQFVY